MRIKRSRRGMSTVALIMVLAFFVVLPLGLLSFEFARYTLLASQLQSVTDAATLAGTAALASSPPGYTYTDLHNLAMDVAVQTFEQNSVLQTPFSAANVVANKNTAATLGTPPLHKAHLNITLLNQAGSPVATGSNTAVTMRVASIYSDAPIFASSLLKIGAIETASAVSDGGLPQLDLILCFDVSGSMDDQTKVALVKRFWNPGIDTVDYKVQSSNKSIYDTFKPPVTGTGLNALPPQNLFKGSYPGATGNASPFVFSDNVDPSVLPAPNLANGLRGNQKVYAVGSIPGLPLATKYPPGALVAEQGWPPGNFDPTNRLNPSGNGVNPNAQPTCYTDLVVKVPSVGPYDFSKIETCVEASRGNMESDAICLQSHGHNTINPVLPPRQPGYYAAYWSQVEKTADPIAAARAAADNFFYTMNIASNAHFGICTFSDAAGTSPSSSWPDTNSKCDPLWPHSGTASFPVPLISLNKTQSNFAEVNEAVDGTATTLPLRPTGKTCISLSLHEAITELIDPAKFRPKAKKAIVLFTDGVPNLPGGDAAAKAAAFSEADWAKSKSIPIYTIGLSQNAAIKPLEDAVLGDSAAKPGIAYRSGNNAIYVSVTNSADLNSAFQTIARSLVVLQ